MVTHLIDLDPEAAVAPRHTVQKHIRSAHKRGGVVSRFTRNDDFDAFYKLVKITKESHGQKARFGPDFFRRLLDVSAGDDRVIWLKVTAENKIIASRIAVVHRDQLFAWQFFHNRDFSRYKPSYLLLDHILELARDRALRAVNLGTTPGAAESVVTHKESWGARPATIPYYTYFSRTGKMLYRWRRP